MTEYDVTYPDSRELCTELQKLADDCGKWGARRAQSLVARARARIIDLWAVLENGVELADLDAAQFVVNQLTMELKREREKREQLELEIWRLQEALSDSDIEADRREAAGYDRGFKAGSRCASELK